MSEQEGFHTEPDAPEIEHPKAVKLTEDAQAKAFVDVHDDNLRYVEEIDQWYRHNSNNNCWEGISRLAIIEAARLMNRGTAIALDQEPLRKKLSSRSFAQSVEGFSRGDERCLLSIEELDKDPWLLGTPGGIIDLQTGRYIAMGLRPYVTMTTAVAPANEANDSTCPLFLKFMNEFTCGDKELQRYLLQYGGYCLTGDMREQCLIFLFGDGDNGKTVFIQLLRNLLNDYALNAAIDLFVTTSIGKHATGFADLHRRRCVITNETQEGQTLRLDKIKQITGQDPMRANFMRKDNFEFRPVCKFIMFGNHKPNLPDVGKAVKKRIRMVPCNLRLKEGQMDRDLPAKLMMEGPGILRAMIDGCLDWQKHGLMTPECVEEQTDSYFSAQDVRKQWFEECCVSDANAKVSSSDVWQSWTTWAEHRKCRVGTDVELSDWLESCGFKKKDHVRMSDGRRPRGWEGLALRGEQMGIPDFGAGAPSSQRLSL
jgi:putative DNA primase/helicase